MAETMDKSIILKKLKDFSLGLERGTIKLSDYNPLWRNAFNHIKNLIKPLIGSAKIFHVGSTSIPGCTAKPILDILIIHFSTTHFSDETKKLESLGFKPKGEMGIKDRSFFTFYDLTEIIDFVHIHAFPEHHPNAQKMLLFKENLLKSKKDMHDYCKHKKMLIASGISRKDYPEAKTDFVMKILKK